MFSTGLLDFHLKKILSTLRTVVFSYKKIYHNLLKNFLLSSFISSFDGEMLDTSYNLKNFYNSVFIAFLSKSSYTKLEKYTDRHEKLYLNHSVVYFTKFFFCIITAINLFLKSTVELCVIITVLLSVILVFNTIFVIFKLITISFLVFFA